MSVTLVILPLLLLGVSSAKREVNVQPGPLYRTAGSHTTIWCNVSGYQGSAEQDFQWSIYLPSAPEREIQIISTKDPDYAYALYSQRVRNKEIYIERVSRDSVVLHIAKLQLQDQGEFECYTPNTEAQYLGVYSAKMNLTVIPDTLSVSSIGQTISKVEGDSLHVTCEVTEQTSQHSHLSVAWFLRGAEQQSVQEIISLSRDFVLRPGGSYKQRYASGDVRLDKTSSTTYKLTIYRMQPADHGEIFCEAAEWIQEPDRTWFAMTKKQSNKTVVTVQAADKEFSIQINTERRTYIAGEPLELRCIIDAQNTPERYFTVSWVFSSTQVAIMGPNAVPVFSGEYIHRESAGQLTFRKESDSVYLLKIYQLRQEDSGKYICRVTEREKTVTGDFIDKNKRSRNVPITVQPLKSNLTVSVTVNSSNVQEGESIYFVCSVHSSLDKGGRFSVSWQLTDRQSQAWDIMSIDRDGIIRPGPSYRERSSYGEIRTEKVQTETFTLTVYNALPKDQGLYTCSVSNWVQGPSNEWEKVGEKSAGTPVTVTAVESVFSMAASSRTPTVTYNDSFDLQCIIKPRYNSQVPVSVTWRFQPVNATEFHDLVTFTRHGTLHWGDRYPSFSSRTTIDKSVSSSNFRLSISKASEQEAGTYQCSAELWRKNYDNTWTKITNRSSNLLGIKVLQPASKLRVNKTARSLVFVEDSRVPLNCTIISQTSPDSQYTVLWYSKKTGETEAELLLKLNHNSAFEYGTYAEEERLKSRVQSERLSPQLYSLTLHQAELSDSGTYYCQVEEWLLDPNNVWYKLAEESSGITNVTIKQPEIKLNVEESVSNITLQEQEAFSLGCSITSQSSKDSRFSVSWYVYKNKGDGSEEPDAQCVFSIGHDSVFGNGNCSPSEGLGLRSRLQFERATSESYSLTIQKAGVEDMGNYYCHVEEWLMNPRNVWYRLAESNSEITVVSVLEQGSTLQSVICSNDSLFYFVFFYPFPIFGILLITILLVRYKARNSSKSSEGKNGAPLLWIKEPHINYSPTCLEPPSLNLHPGSVE
ncbi:LOW QUALITY PROTEIN: immunoglobulin superfamily member 3 [Erpetoichthys calabaricus]|uniref:LOW QUALITY PROTEIN: immunoglobulin superfamily member 3 n=1 Tax=Erpetoichthys calabaricus TaxID=27687 RepID=UPI00223471EE|nr:LOW QUALITY PROTEIN: immunoglobulin superfamily member 3 [Erpetoichthys calabaricus]